LFICQFFWYVVIGLSKNNLRFLRAQLDSIAKKLSSCSQVTVTSFEMEGQLREVVSDVVFS